MFRKKKKVIYEYSRSDIKRSILQHARSTKVAPGWAEQIAERVADDVDKWIANKDIITENDLRKKIIKELDVLCPDIAYVYKNHDKII
jgi:2-phosphoglycerate kinase